MHWLTLYHIVVAQMQGFSCWVEAHATAHGVWHEWLCGGYWRITEDSPLWNCHTMGNHKCG